MDEYGATADKPWIIETLAPGESVDVEIPIRFMYVGDFEPYTLVMNRSGDAVAPSAPISLLMPGDSQGNPAYVLVVSIASEKHRTTRNMIWSQQLRGLSPVSIPPEIQLVQPALSLMAGHGRLHLSDPVSQWRYPKGTPAVVY